ncbi:hypothetical protein ATCV1_z116R [Acanthocystis turfacea chlorella virus 1]|uniref:Uncharacterized protein z116R n=1 Tax=Chlorovirus heliozoae TaxID=322019 RepID=A7K876_9PHYC|nr:hypothetical protein ATCV1_z116R [Acanthocystis turfacea chlorella virus 1]ABT16250.1 hypothetical protein ATCV1_z116R [Acanthocystis turfacea chlorella virus 1]
MLPRRVIAFADTFPPAFTLNTSEPVAFRPPLVHRMWLNEPVDGVRVSVNNILPANAVLPWMIRVPKAPAVLLVKAAPPK